MLAGSLASSRSPDVQLSRYERRRDECCTHMSSTRTGRWHWGVLQVQFAFSCDLVEWQLCVTSGMQQDVQQFCCRSSPTGRLSLRNGCPRGKRCRITWSLPGGRWACACFRELAVGLPALQYTSLCVLWDCVLPTGWACACCKPEVSDFVHDWLGCGAQPRSTLWSGLHVVCAVVSSRSALPLPIWAGLHCVWLQRGTSLHKRPLGLQSRKVCKRLRDTSMSAVSATVCLAGVCVGLHSL